MAEDEEVEMIMFPPSKDQLQAFTGKELSQFLKKKGFPVDQCRILEGMFFSHSVLAVNSVFSDRIFPAQIWRSLRTHPYINIFRKASLAEELTQ